MTLTPDAFSILVSLFGSSVLVGISWGVGRAKVDTLKERMGELREELGDYDSENERAHKTFVTREGLQDAINPMRDQLKEIQRDVKTLLRQRANRPETEHN